MENIILRITDVTLNDFGLECFKLLFMEKPLASNASQLRDFIAKF